MTNDSKGGARERKTTRSRATSQEAVTPTKQKKKTSALKLVHPRLRASDVALTEVLEAQRGHPFADLARRIYEHGVLLEAATGTPDEDGNYGIYSGERLAQLLIPTVDSLIAFVMRYGQVPHTVQVLQGLLQQGSVSSPGLITARPESHSVPLLPQEETLLTEAAPEALATINLFAGGGANLTEDSENEWP